MTWISSLASASMAVGPPLVYADQYFSIIRRKSSVGFSTDVCGVLLIANITRCFYWIGARFEAALLIQSVLMILFQLVLLEACLRYRDGPPASPSQAGSVQATPAPDPDGEEASLVQDPEAGDVASTETMAGPLRAGPLGATAGHTPHVPTLRRRILGSFWGWQDYGSYLEFLALLIATHAVMLVIFWGVVGWDWYIQLLGILALGLESTLPIPQLVTNWRRKSLAGFRMTVLAGWLFGDAYKAVYFFLQEGNSPQFKICAVFQLSVDCLIAVQAVLYRNRKPRPLSDADPA